jgi:golgi phosphoprotein 3
MLTFAEEIYLLALDDVTGKILVSSRKIVLDTVLIGAILAELSFKNRIDSDTENIYVQSTDATGNILLDMVLNKFAEAEGDTFTINHALRVIMQDSEKLEDVVLAQLINKGILKKVEERVLWFFSSRRYPVIDNHEITDVETRLRKILLSDEIPDPGDAVLISLVDACDLFREILSPREFKRCETRIAELSKLDLVVQKIKLLISQIEEIANLTPYI